MMSRNGSHASLSGNAPGRWFGAAAALACLLAVPRANADLHYTQSVSMAQTPAAAMPGMTARTSPVMRLTTDVKGRHQRQEMSMQTGAFKATTITLTLCDTGQMIRIDPVLKIYTATPIDESPLTPFGLPSLPRLGFGGTMDTDAPSLLAGPGSGIIPKGLTPMGTSPFPSAGAPTPSDAVPSEAAPFGQPGTGTVNASPMIQGDTPSGDTGAAPFPAPTVPMEPGPETKTDAVATPATGRVVLTYTCHDLGTETIHDLTTHHYAVTVRRQASGGAGTSDTTTKMEIWFAPVKTGLACPERTALRRTVTNPRGSKITYEVQGDTDALSQIADQLPVRVRFYDKRGNEQGTLEMQEYDQTSLGDGLFTLPANDRQVTASEFARAESQARFQGLMGGGGPMLPSGSGGAYPAPSGGGLPGAGNGAFPPPTNGGSGPVNPSGAYPSPTPPAPTGN